MWKFKERSRTQDSPKVRAAIKRVVDKARAMSNGATPPYEFVGDITISASRHHSGQIFVDAWRMDRKGRFEDIYWTSV
jgi:hypothetical protein